MLCLNPNPVVPDDFIPKRGTEWWVADTEKGPRRVLCRGECDDLIEICYLDEPKDSEKRTGVCLERDLFDTKAAAAAVLDR